MVPKGRGSLMLGANCMIFFLKVVGSLLLSNCMTVWGTIVAVVCVLPKSLSRKVCSLGGHIYNASGQLKQDQVLSK